MSKLDELIEKYCPNGVEYKELRDACNNPEGCGFQPGASQQEGADRIFYRWSK